MCVYTVHVTTLWSRESLLQRESSVIIEETLGVKPTDIDTEGHTKQANRN